MITANKIKRQHGMTLIEVIVSLAILSILLTIAIGTLSGINKSKRALDDYQDVYLVAQSLLRRMTRELQLASCDLDANSKCQQGKGIIMPPNQGGTSSLHPVLKSGSTNNKKNSISDIIFLAMDAGQYMQEQQSNLGLVQVAYFLRKANSEDSLYELIRQEVPLIDPPEEAYRKSLTFPVAKNVVQLSFEFYDMLNSREWVNEWGTEKTSISKLPTLIRCTIVMRSASGIDVPFRTTVAIRSAS